MIGGNGVGQAAQLAAHGAELGEDGAHHARILADFEQRFGAGPAFGGQAIKLLEEGVDLLAGGLGAPIKRAQISGAMDGSPAAGIFAGSGAKVLRHQTRIPQALFVDHRYLSRHNTAPSERFTFGELS